MIYLDNGATTYPKPTMVYKAVNRALTSYGANPGRSGHYMSMKASEIIFECRKNVARLFDIENPENIIFTNNCTTALNTVIKGTLKSGDHAVISSLEHNSVVRPLEALKEKGITYSVAEYVPYDDDSTIDNFRNAINSNTKMVICTHASNVFGVKLPVMRISALCRIYGILFCLDAAQTAGVTQISLKDSCIDYLCTAGHKGLFGPMGTGILVINNDIIPTPLIEGGTGSMSANVEQPELLPDKYESGTPNLTGIAGLNQGVKYIEQRGINNIERYEISLAKRLYNGLKGIKDVILYTKEPNIENSVSVISFNILGMDCEKVAEILNMRYNIAVRAGLHCSPFAHKQFATSDIGTVRVVISIFNTKHHIDYFCQCINKIAKLKK